MIIQSTPHINQAASPGIRTAAPAAVAVPPTAVQPAAAQPTPAPATAAELKVAVTAINQVLQQSNQNLEFSVDADSNKTVVKMKDTSTGELIRQFPSESVLAIARQIDQFQQGLLLTQEA